MQEPFLLEALLYRLLWLVPLGVLVAASVIDMRSRRIPNSLVITLACLWVALVPAAAFVDALLLGVSLSAAFESAAFIPPPGSLFVVPAVQGLVGALVLGGGSLAVALVYERLAGRESFGGGDVKLLAVVGLYLGWERGLVCVFVACLVALVREGACCLVKRPTDGAFPFAPMITIGAVVATLLPIG